MKTFGEISDIVDELPGEIVYPVSVAELRVLLVKKYPSLAHHNFMVSINRKIVTDHAVLNEADELALMSPFSGG